MGTATFFRCEYQVDFSFFFILFLFSNYCVAQLSIRFPILFLLPRDMAHIYPDDYQNPHQLTLNQWLGTTIIAGRDVRGDTLYYLTLSMPDKSSFSRLSSLHNLSGLRFSVRFQRKLAL